MSFTFQNTRVRSSNKRARRFGPHSLLLALLASGIALVSLIGIFGLPWWISTLETQNSTFSSWESTPEEGYSTKYSENRIRKLERKVAKLARGATKVRSCRRFENEGDQRVFGIKCQEKLQHMDATHRSVVVYNPAPYDRFWCGIKLAGKHSVTLSESDAKKLLCKEPARMLERNPTVDGTGMPPIHLMSAGDEFYQGGALPAETFDCDIPCTYERGGGNVIRYFKVQGMDVTIVNSMESSQHYPELQIREDAYYRSNAFYATTSLRSEIPLPYFSWAEYNISNPAVRYEDVIHGASFLAQNCQSMSKREKIVKELMKRIRVDSLSECLHNADPPAGIDDGGLAGKIAIMRSYLFHLAFENSIEDDYVTEKLWATLQAGTLPIYYGAPNVKEHAPPHSIISWHDFNSTKQLAKYMNKVANDKELYESFHEWRRKPLPESFRKKFDFTKTHSVCRMCRWAYAKKYGLGWNHETQTVQNVATSRDLQYAMTSKVIKPFREAWLPPGKGAGWSRTAWQHDGVIDIHFEALPQSSSAVYRMETPMRGEIRADKTSCHVFTLQNDVTRMTILTSWEAVVESPHHNVIDITLEPSLNISRVRVIIEDVDKFHKGADKVKNYFGKVMERDFFTPMEAFIVEGTRIEIASAAN